MRRDAFWIAFYAMLYMTYHVHILMQGIFVIVRMYVC
jgi:hypothetical protein